MAQADAVNASVPSPLVPPAKPDETEQSAVEKRLEELLAADSSPQLLVNSLKNDALELRQKRKAVAKELKNAQKRSKRIRDRAKQLSDADLVAVLRMRTERKLGDVSKVEGKEGDLQPQNNLDAPRLADGTRPMEEPPDDKDQESEEDLLGLKRAEKEVE